MPIIGITCTYVERKEMSTLGVNYTRAFLLAGGTPVILPTLPPEKAPEILAGISGLVLSGGGDVDAALLREDPHPSISGVEPERDLFELALARLALERDLPLLGICRGAQILALAAGGRLTQHLEPGFPGRILHLQSAPRSHPCHRVILEKETWLAQLAGGDELRVNSFHHQAIEEMPPGFRRLATAPDGVIEALEDPRRKFALGVQWHPEGQVETCEVNLRILQRFVAAAS